MGEVREAQKGKRQHDKYCQQDEPLLEQMVIIYELRYHGKGGTTHWSDAQRQVVLREFKVVGAHKGLKGTTAIAAYIAHGV